MKTPTGTPPSGDQATCPGCDAEVSAGDAFCEACGRHLTAERCTGCGAAAIADDGYCERCGLRRPAPRDHVEIELVSHGVAGGVSDRGLRHSRNEDAMALAAPAGGVLAVVCDGVSSSPRPQDAAQTAADTGAAVLAEQLQDGAGPERATRAAVAAAAEAVTALADGDGAPACTYVSAVVGEAEITVGWVGDSRAYWLAGADGTDGEGTDRDGTDRDGTDPDSADADGMHFAGMDADRTDGEEGGHARPSAVLTTDDSWAARMVAMGAMSEAEAQNGPDAHTLTAWLGADADGVAPHVRTFAPGGPGTILICSDGLWNYLPAADRLAAALTETPGAAGAPLPAARSLVRTALDAGGRDNVTVVVIPFPPRPRPSSPLTAEPPN